MQKQTNVKKKKRKKTKRKNRNLRIRHLMMSALAKERARARVKTKAQGKARAGFATFAVINGILHESVQPFIGKEGGRIGSHRNSGRTSTLASSRSSGAIGGQEIRKARAKGPDQSYGSGGRSVIGREGLFKFPQLGCVNPTQ